MGKKRGRKWKKIESYQTDHNNKSHVNAIVLLTVRPIRICISAIVRHTYFLVVSSSAKSLSAA